MPAKMALRSRTMVAAAVVSVCVHEGFCLMRPLCYNLHMLLCFVCAISSACGNSATDVVFVIDGSKSVRPENFELVKKWINQIIDKLDVSESKAHVGLVQYSSLVKQVQYLPVYHLKNKLLHFLSYYHPASPRSFPWAATTTRKI